MLVLVGMKSYYFYVQRKKKEEYLQMSFSVHFFFIEKNPPDFFFPLGACWVELGSTDVLDCNGNVRDFGSVLVDGCVVTSTPKLKFQLLF